MNVSRHFIFPIWKEFSNFYFFQINPTVRKNVCVNARSVFVDSLPLCNREGPSNQPASLHCVFLFLEIHSKKFVKVKQKIERINKNIYIFTIPHLNGILIRALFAAYLSADNTWLSNMSSMDISALTVKECAINATKNTHSINLSLTIFLLVVKCARIVKMIFISNKIRYNMRLQIRVISAMTLVIWQSESNHLLKLMWELIHHMHH